MGLLKLLTCAIPLLALALLSACRTAPDSISLEPAGESVAVLPRFPELAETLLTDRVLVARGEGQRYGTQYETRTEDGVIVFGPAAPIEEPETLDVRRTSMGLGPHADDVEELRRVLAIPADARIEGP